MMENVVIQRLKRFFEAKHLSVNAASKMAGINQTTLNRQLIGRMGLNFDSVYAILVAFDKLSAEWLIRGSGPMELDGSDSDPELKAVCIDQAKEILQLKLRIAELEGEKKELA